MNGVQRIQASFAKNQAFVGYLTAGDGGIQRTLAAARALIDGGINLLEIGVPFSDPIADGPVIQRASARALSAGTTLKNILWLAAEIRKISAIPLILFSYLNPILSVSRTEFFCDAASAGIDGVLLVDCPIEESADFHQQCLAHYLAPIYVVAPSTPLPRICQIDQHGQGFLYYACRKGTTGMRSGLPDDFAEKMRSIKARTRLPVVSGFGISEAEAAKKVLEYADGVVVGSLFVKALEDKISMDQLTTLAQSVNPFMR